MIVKLTLSQTIFRYHFLSINMLNNDNWKLSYHTWSLVHTYYMDILLCCEVLFLASTNRSIYLDLRFFHRIDFLN